MAHFFKIKISVVAAGDNFPDACTEERRDLEDAMKEALLPSEVSNLGASRVCTTKDDLEWQPSTQTPVADQAEVGMLFFPSPGCPCSAAIGTRCWASEQDAGQDAQPEPAPLVSHVHVLPLKSTCQRGGQAPSPQDTGEKASITVATAL